MSLSGVTGIVTLPDYLGGSIVNLIASIAVYLGNERWEHPPLRALDPTTLRARGRILLLIVDGLGYDYLCEAHSGTSLRRFLHADLTSVFPSTTATAITTTMSGLAPQQHGLTGWHMYLAEIDEVGAVLPFRQRPSDAPLVHHGLQPAQVFDYPVLFDRIRVPSTVISPASIVDSQFNTAHAGGAQRRGYASLTQFFELIEQSLRGVTRFVYAYYPELDSAAHEHGIGAARTAEVLRRFDAGFDRLLAALAGHDVTVLVTADHGFLDADDAQRIELDDHPELADMLAHPLCGEQRVAYCYVRPGRTKAFEDYVGNELGARVELLETPKVIEQGWFGPGTPHPRLQSRTGDYVMLMKERATIKDWMPGEKRYRLIGVHGGLSDDEMRVPLIVVQP